MDALISMAKTNGLTHDEWEQLLWGLDGMTNGQLRGLMAACNRKGDRLSRVRMLSRIRGWFV